MEEKTQDRLSQTQENNTAENKPSRHTWIGDAEEIKAPDYSEQPIPRTTYQDIAERQTKLVVREKKPYRGFITDEEVKNAEAAAEIDRMARAESRAAREGMAQTRIYTGLGSGLEDEDKKAEEEEKPVKKRRKRSFNVRVADSNKFRRLVALAAVFVLLLLFEISYFVMKAETAALPGRTASLRSQVTSAQANNAELKKTADELGDYDDIEALRDSWKTIRDKLAE